MNNVLTPIPNSLNCLNPYMYMDSSLDTKALNSIDVAKKIMYQLMNCGNLLKRSKYTSINISEITIVLEINLFSMKTIFNIDRINATIVYLLLMN